MINNLGIPDLHFRVINLYEDGSSTREVGEELNLHGSYVSRILKRYGIPARTGQICKTVRVKFSAVNPDDDARIRLFASDQFRLAYLAGIIDGEGCLLIYLKVDSRNKMTYRCVLKIANTSQRLIDWLTTHLGGTVSRSKKHRINRLPMYHWNYEGPKARLLVELVSPQLLIKSEMADIFIRMQSRLMYSNSGTSLSREEIDVRNQLFAEYKEERLRSRGR